MTPIQSNELIKDSLFNYTSDLLTNDSYLDIYFHAKGGNVQIEGGPFGEQIINSLPIIDEDQEFIIKTISGLNQTLDIDFRLTANYEKSDIAIFFDSEINVGEDNVIGIAYENYNSGEGRWEIILDTVAINDSNYLHYALIHELGHTLGLEHPFDDSDGDVYNDITSPWLSLYPEETVMAYRFPRLGIWPEEYTQNDLMALTSLWGEEINSISFHSKNQLFGTINSDYLVGYSGDNFGPDILVSGPGDDTLKGFRGSDFLDGGEGNDELRGGNGRDTLTGGIGKDSIFGGFGINTFNDLNDGFADQLYFKSDHLAYNWLYDKAGNSPYGQKADKIEELDLLDKVYIQGAENDQLTFIEGVNHINPQGNTFNGIGIYADGVLEAVYVGENLSLSELKSLVFTAEA